MCGDGADQLFEQGFMECWRCGEINMLCTCQDEYNRELKNANRRKAYAAARKALRHTPKKTKPVKTQKPSPLSARSKRRHPRERG